MISQRTKAALQEKKRQGYKLEKPENLNQEAIKKGLDIRLRNAKENDNNRKAGALIVSMRNAGKSFYQIAKDINSIEFRTRRDCIFNQVQVKRLFERYENTLQ